VGDTVGECDPGLAAAGLRGGEDQSVVVDGRQGASHEEDVLRQVDVVPVQSESFALAQAGPDEDLDEVGEEQVERVAAAQKACRLVRGPDAAFRGGGSRDDGGARGVAGEAVVADGVAEGAGEGGQDLVDGDLPASAIELSVDVAGQVGVAEVVQEHIAQGRDEVIPDVVAGSERRSSASAGAAWSPARR
jgi:hypothetical protein